MGAVGAIECEEAKLTPVRDLWLGVLSALTAPSVLRILALVFTLITGASVFYHFVEGWTWLDAIYFSVMTIATVGFGDLAPRTDLGKLFTIVYVIMGLGLFVAAASAVAQAVIARPSDSEPP